MAYTLGMRKTGKNYFGSGIDGAVTISSNTNLTSTTDGEFVIMQYSSLTVNVGTTLSVSNRCKGLIIYVQGACVLNGVISMSGKGPALASATDGLIYRYFPDAAGARGLITEFLSVATGGAGGAAQTVTGQNGLPGGTATNGTGGGGSGALRVSGASGGGGTGTCYSGGSGGGAGSGATATAASGAGAGGAAAGTGENGGHGGTGNPGGAGSGSGGLAGTSGNGGFILLIVGGNLTIGASGGLRANGVNGTNSTAARVGGGASGGGRIGCFYAGTLSNSGTLTATGGAGGTANNNDGGNGGNGSVTGPTKIAA